MQNEGVTLGIQGGEHRAHIDVGRVGTFWAGRFHPDHWHPLHNLDTSRVLRQQQPTGPPNIVHLRDSSDHCPLYTQHSIMNSVNDLCVSTCTAAGPRVLHSSRTSRPLITGTATEEPLAIQHSALPRCCTLRTRMPPAHQPTGSALHFLC